MIIAVKEEGNVVLAYSNGSYLSFVSERDRLLPENVGLWKLSNQSHAIVGCHLFSAGSDMLRYDCRVFAGELDYDGIIKRVIPKIKDKLGGLGLYSKKNGMVSDIVIANGDRLFMIGADELIATEIDDAIAIAGSNSEVILSVLDSAKGSAEERIKEAVRATEQLCKCRYFPVVTMNTRTGRRKIIYR